MKYDSNILYKNLYFTIRIHLCGWKFENGIFTHVTILNLHHFISQDSSEIN